jgi:prepilin-type N-terminal cleavage/methylation domain-containing protein
MPINFESATVRPLRFNLSSRRGITLLEVIVTVVIMAIMAAAMIGPSSRAIADTRRVGAENEILQTLITARSRAIATGRPNGVTIITSPTPTVTPVVLSGTTVSTRTDALEPVPAASRYQIQSRYPGVTMSVSGMSSSTIWFGIDGTPELRGSNGLRTGTATSDASIQVVGGSTIVVRAVSGLVERQP